MTFIFASSSSLLMGSKDIRLVSYFGNLKEVKKVFFVFFFLFEGLSEPCFPRVLYLILLIAKTQSTAGEHANECFESSILTDTLFLFKFFITEVVDPSPPLLASSFLAAKVVAGPPSKV